MLTMTKLNKLAERVKNLVQRRRAEVRRLQCAGASREEIANLFEASLAPESLPVLDTIIQQAEEYQRQPSYTLVNGTEVFPVHGFARWVRALHDGWAELHERIPHVVILAWRDGYK